MTLFTVSDMTCDACVTAITRAIRAADPAAAVKVDLPTGRVEIASARPAAALAAAIEDAGYTIAAAA